MPKAKVTSPKPIKAYMCGVAWQHEIGNTEVELFESAASCAKTRKCTDECGIVEVEVRLKRWVKKQRIGEKYDSEF